MIIRFVCLLFFLSFARRPCFTIDLSKHADVRLPILLLLRLRLRSAVSYFTQCLCSLVNTDDCNAPGLFFVFFFFSCFMLSVIGRYVKRREGNLFDRRRIFSCVRVCVVLSFSPDESMFEVCLHMRFANDHRHRSVCFS